MKFKKGDKVRFISPATTNARFFRKGLRDLEILKCNRNGTHYAVWECDKSTSWSVRETELELESIDNWKEVLEQ